MESKILIDIDYKGSPFIWIDFKPSDDLRDKVLSRFFTDSGAFLTPSEQHSAPLTLQIVHIDEEKHHIQAMIEIPKVEKAK